MGFKDDALDYVREEAIPAWQKKAARQDSYIPRTLIPKVEWDAQKDPDSPYPLLGHTEIKDEELVDLDHGVVIGRAGAGKSYLISETYRKALRRFDETDGETPLPIYLDFSSHEIPTSNSIRDALNSGSVGDLFERASEHHPSGIHLFLDEVDTQIRQQPASATDFGNELYGISTEIEELRFLMTSREREWKRFKGLRLEGDAGELRVLAFPDGPIGDEYSHLIPDTGRRKTFFKECNNRGYYDLLSLAFDGFELARRFNDTGQLPSTREELWDQRIDARLVKSDAAVEVTQAPSRHRLRYLAQLLACISCFSGKTTWSLRDAIDDLGTPMVGHEQPVTPSEVKWLLQSRLFTLAQQDRYQFIHERYRDKLTAEALARLKPRKQQILLQAGIVNGRHRVAPKHRTVATTLASTDSDSAFRNQLIENEPEVAAFSSLPRLNPEQRRDLISAVIEWGRQGPHFPWLEIQGIGERLDSALARHQVEEPDSFLESYIRSDSEMDRLWGTTLAARWGGTPALGDTLADLATDDEEKTGTRKRALEALEKGRDPAHLNAIESLVQDPADEVRGYALSAWRTLGEVSPAEYVDALSKGRSQTNLYSSLSRDPRRFARTLGREEIEEAFRSIDKHVTQARKNQGQNPLGHLPGLNSLHASLLGGLLDRLKEVKDIEVPFDLLVDLFVRPSLSPTGNEEFMAALNADPEFWHDIYENAFNRVGSLDPSPAQLTGILAETIPAEPEEILPNDDNLSTAQAQYVGRIRTQAKYNQGTLGDSDSAGSEEGNPHTPILEGDADIGQQIPSSVTSEVMTERVRDVLDACSGSDADCTTALIKEIWRIRAQVDDSSKNVRSNRVARLKRGEVVHMLGLLDDDLQQDVVSLFESAFPSIANQPIARAIVRVLIDISRPPSPNAVKDFLASTGYWGDDSRSELQMHVLSYLREEDRDAWRDIIDHLAGPDSDGDKGRRTLQHLIDSEDKYYLSQAEARLRGADHEHRGEWKWLLKYVRQHAPQNMVEILNATFHSAESKRHLIQENTSPDDQATDYLSKWDVTSILFELIKHDEGWGWILLDERLDSEKLPLTDRTRHSEIPVPEPETRFHLKVLAHWYQQIQTAMDEANFDSEYEDGSDFRVLAQEIMKRIVNHASQAAVETVLDLQQNGNFESANRLSSRRLDAEDAYLTSEHEQYLPQRLLEFILKDYFHLVESDRDLHELLLQTLDYIQEDFDEGRGVAGFWESVPESNEDFTPEESDNRAFCKRPRDETNCQNVLWGLIKPRLREYGLTDVEEDFVGPNKADLRIEYAEPGQPPFRTFLELKVANRNYSYNSPDSDSSIEDPLVDQLWYQYLRPTGVQYGIYAVIWARDPDQHAWPSAEDYETPDELEQALQEKVDALKEEHDVVITPYVLDVTAPYRE